MRVTACLMLWFFAVSSIVPQETANCEGVLFPEWSRTDLSTADALEAEGRYDEATDIYRALPNRRFGELLESGRRAARRTRPSWSFRTPEDAYRAFRSHVGSAALSEILPPVLIGNVYESDVLVGLTGSCWADVLTDVVGTLRVSRLEAGEVGHYFALSDYGRSGGETLADSWFRSFPSLVFHIIPVQGSVFDALNERYEIAFVRLFSVGMEIALKEAASVEPRGIPLPNKVLYGVERPE